METAGSLSLSLCFLPVKPLEGPLVTKKQENYEKSQAGIKFNALFIYRQQLWRLT
jgi:hypothetical protein